MDNMGYNDYRLLWRVLDVVETSPEINSLLKTISMDYLNGVITLEDAFTAVRDIVLADVFNPAVKNGLIMALMQDITRPDFIG